MIQLDFLAMCATPTSDAWPEGGGAMAARIRGHDWGATALGPVRAWPDRLRAAVEAMLALPLPVALLVGDRRLLIWNDAATRPFALIEADLARPLDQSAAGLRALSRRLLDRVATGEPVQADAAVREGRDGATAELVLTPVRDAAGKVMAIQVLRSGERTRDGRGWGFGAADREAPVLARDRLLIPGMGEGFALAKMIRDQDGRPLDWRFLEVRSEGDQADGPVDQLVGRTMREVNPQIDPAWIETCGQVVRTGVPVAHEAHLAGADRWVETFAFRLSGDQLGLLFRDVTERVRDREAQRQSGRRKEFLLRLGDALRAETGADSVAVRALTMLRDFMGLDRCCVADFRLDEDRARIPHQVGGSRVPPIPDEIRLSDFPQALRVTFDQTLVIHDSARSPEFGDRDRASMARLGFGALIAPVLRRGAQRPLWTIVAVSARPRRWSPQEISLAEEVAERTWAAMQREEARAKVQDSERRYRVLFDAMGDGYVEMDVVRGRDGQIVDFRYGELNRALERLTGLRRPDVIGRTLSEVLPAGDLARWLPLFRGIAERGGPETFEEYSEWFDRWYEVSVYPRDGARLSIFYRDVTKRKQAEDRLSESEAKLSAIFASALVGLSELTLEGRFLRVNEELCRILGRTAAELLSLSVSEVTHPEDRAKSIPVTEAVRAGAGSLRTDKRYLRPDGGIVPVNSSLTLLPNGGGQADTLLDVTMDMSDQHKAEQALKLGEERFRTIVERAIDYAIFTIDSFGRIDSWPPGACQVFGWTEAEALGQPFDMTFVPEDRARGIPAEELGKAREYGLAPDVRWHQHRSGSRVFIEGMVRPLIGPGGEISGYVKVGQDVTRRRAVQAALGESEARFRQFGEASADVIWIRNCHDLAFEYLSPAFERVYGASRADMMAGDHLQRWAGMILPEDRERALGVLHRVRGGEQIVHTFRIQLPDGRIRWLRDTGFPLRDANGQVQRIGGIADDVTEEMELQERLRTLMGELQHRSRNLIGVVQGIAERTLATSTTLAEFAERFRGRLSAVGRANGLLSRLTTGNRVTFDQLVNTELEAQSGAGADLSGQVALDGPEGVALPSATVQTFALALHELMTNALRHGALSGPEGRLSVSWRLLGATGDEPRLEVEWIETLGGRPGGAGGEIVSGPSRKGFGRELIERALPYQLGAEVHYDLAASGLRCRIVVPVPTAAAPASSGEDPDRRT